MSSVSPDEPSPLVSPAAGAASGRSATAVGAAMMTMNVLAYAFTLLAAHALGPIDFGGVGALLGVIIVANVGSLTIQATAARRLATTSATEASAVRSEVVRTGVKMSVAIGVGLFALVPLLDRVLQLDDWVATGAVAPTCAALTMMGAYAGIAQGERRWYTLATIYLAMGVGRIVAGGTAVLLDPTTRSAMIGIAIGSLAPLAVGWLSCPRDRQASMHTPAMLAELWRNGHTLLAFFAFTNLDILLARHLFTHHQAGIYAGGAIISKACLFLPTFVLVIAFPSMATERAGRPWLKPLLFVLGLGLVAVLATLALPAVAQAFAGGSTYVGLGAVAWVFALEGTLFAALQILVYDTIAGQTHAAALLWAGVVAMAVLALPLARTVAGLAGIAAGIALVLCVAVAVLPQLRPESGTATRPRTRQSPEPQP